MATYIAGMIATRAALKARLHSLTPNWDQTIKFWSMSDSAQSQYSASEATGRARLIELARGEFSVTNWIYSQTDAIEFRIPLKITYPNTVDWRDAAFDDFDIIGKSLRESPLSATGLALCVVDMEAGPEFEDVTDDEWFVMTVLIQTICEAT